MDNLIFEYKTIEGKITDLKEISIIIKQMNKNDTLLPRINKKIRSLIFEQANIMKWYHEADKM